MKQPGVETSQPPIRVELLPTFAEPVPSLYVHVPFCARKCEYCAFYSEPSSGEVINRYVEALIHEMELVAGEIRPRTIFFGGGTPSLLNVRQWERLLDSMHGLGLRGAAEWTVECNPATVSLDKAKLLRSRGVNRISMGVQSLDEGLLERLGRVHTREMVFRSFDVLRQAGFENLNVDLMFAIPGQTIQNWRDTLREALALQSEHLSCYEVIYEEDTPLFAQLKARKFDVDEDLACVMYEEFVNSAAGAGFHQYEVANFARDRRASAEKHAIGAHSVPDVAAAAERLAGEGSLLPSCACRHNVNYWRGGAYYGLGPSAAGYVRGVRMRNWANTQLYCEQLEKGRRAIESSEELNPLARAGETAAFGLRMTSGWLFAEFLRTTGHDLRQEWRADMDEIVARGWGRLTSERFCLTSKGLRFADAAAELFLR